MKVVSSVAHLDAERHVRYVARVEFLVDGKLRHASAAALYFYDWDTSPEAPGSHARTMRAIRADGGVAERTLTVTVAPPTGA